MLKRKLSSIIVVALMTNLAATPLTAFAEAINTKEISQESQKTTESQEITQEIEEATEAKISRFDTYYSNYREAYDKAFRMSNSNIGNVYTNGGYLNYYSTVPNMTDDKLDTYWETKQKTTDSFKNEVIFTLNEETVLNRIAYRSAWNTVGFAEDFEIWASDTVDGNDFTLVAAAKTTKTADMIEIKFNPTSFKRVKFVFKNNGTATISEMMFYKEDKTTDSMSRLFTDGTMSVLSDEFSTIEKINALETEVNNHPLKDNYVEKIELAKKVIENPTEYTQGILTTSQRGDSNKEAKEHQIARTTYNLETFGRYVTPGETIKVYVDADASGVMPQLVLGQLANDKNGWTRFYTLKPGLNTITAPSFDNMAPAVIYAYNPALPSDQAYAPRIRVEGGTEFPVYYHGVTDPAEYEKELEEYTAKISTDDNDFANGVRDDVYYNVTELVSENNLITTSAAGALQGIKEMKSSNKTVADTMNDWEKLWHEYQSFSGFVEGDEDSRNDIYNCIFISRVFTKGPYGWSDWGYTGYNGGTTARRDSGNFKQIVKPFSLVDDWLFYHEWGHNINNSATEEVEVTNNLYSAQMRRVFGTGGGGDCIAWDTLYSRFSGATVSSGYFTNLGMISQPLYYYGTDTYGNAARIARTNPDGILDGLSNNKQRLVITYSLAVGYDLTDFFDGWGYCKATDLMKSKVSNLPKPDVKLEYMNTSGIGYTGEGFTEETNVNIDSFKVNAETNQATITFSVDEKDKNDVMGYEILRDGEVVGYTTNNSFTDENVDADVEYTYDVIAYAKDLTTSKKVSISSKTPTLLSNEKITLKLNEEFNPLNYVNATDYLGAKIDDVQVVGDVDTTKKGTCEIAYEVVSNDVKVTKKATVEVVSDYAYLSDSEWTSVKTDYSTPRKNSDLKLLVNGQVKSFAKGIGIHANGEIVYDLSGKDYDKFEAFVGVSRSITAQNNSSITFSILADGEEVYNSGLMKYNTEAKFVSVDIKGVKELKIVIGDGGNGISSDHAVIANPILTTNDVKPVLEVGKDEIVELRSNYDLKAGVSASDVEDGNLTNKVVITDNGFTTNKSGKYTIGYSVIDSDNNTATAEKNVFVYSESKYLSDMNWESATSGWESVQKDLAVGSNKKIKLNVDGTIKEFDKGIGAATDAEIVYNLDGQYELFTTYVGTDKNYNVNATSIVFKIYADGKEVYTSDLIKTNSKAEFVSLDVTGVKELKLVADDNGDGGYGDFASWADTKVYTANSLPIMNVEEETFVQYKDEFDKYSTLTATDIEDGDMVSKVVIDGNVDTNKAGVYNLTYTVTDSDNNTITKERKVVVYSGTEYLSDIEWESATSGWEKVQKDLAVGSNKKIKLNVDGTIKEFDKGIGAATDAEIIYNLDGKYTAFTTYLGTDKNYNVNATSIVFKIYADGEEVYTSDLIRTNSEAEFVSLDVTGVKELKLVADDNGDGGYGDFASWADTKVYTTNSLPTMNVEEETFVQYKGEFDKYSTLTAYDIEDGDMLSKVVIEGDVNTNKAGVYNLTYTVTDSDNNTITKERKVVVYSDTEYLSDIEWESARTDWNSVRKDKASSNVNIKLLVDGEVKEFAKGIGTHANSEIVYDLEGSNYEYFETYVGVDRNIPEQNNSSVVFKIYADDVEVYNSGVMRYNTEAKLVRIPVSGVSELKIVANDAGNGNSSDHASFGDAKFLITDSLPELTIPESISTVLGQPIDINQAYTATDAEDGNITDNVIVEGTVNFDKTGKYPITYTVTDSDGNTVTKTRSIAVVDMNDFTYLSDLDWKSVNYSYTTPVKDTNISGATISLTNEDGSAKTFEKGIGSHATSTIVYDLTGNDYSYFTSYIGVTRNMYNSIASIGFEVYVDGVLKYSSEVMTGKMSMEFVKVDITDAKELKLVVNDGGNGIGSDHGAWADAKLHYVNENGASINREHLDSLIDTVEGLDSSIYVEETFANLTAALEEVKINLADGYTQEEIDELYDKLNSAYEALVKAKDFSSLEEVIANNSEFNELHYNKADLDAHKALVEEGKAILANENATQEEIDAIVVKITESANNLVIRENKVELEKKIAEAKAVENSGYEEVRWSNFIWSIEYAEEIYHNVNATDDEVTSALFTLDYMKSELK